MNDRDTNFLAPILSALAGFGAIVAALSPLFTQTRITKIFIDHEATGFLAVVAFIIAVLNLWFFGSRTASLVFGPTLDFTKLARRRLAAAILFLVSALVFYGLELAFKSHHITFGWGSFLQAIFYILTFFFLTAVIGMQFRDTYEQYKWQSNEENKTANIRQLLLASGQIQVDLKITAITTHAFDPQSHPQNWQNSYRVVYETNDKQYEAIIDQDINNVLGTAPLTPKVDSHNDNASS